MKTVLDAGKSGAAKTGVLPIDGDLHRELKLIAVTRGVSLRQLVELPLREFADKAKTPVGDR